MKQPDDTTIDPVDQALELLREDGRAELPDPRLEQRLRQAHGRNRSRRPFGLVAAAVVILSLFGATYAAGGLEGLRNWWYRIVIDGNEVTGEVDGDGVRRFEHVTADGARVQVEVADRFDAEGTRRTGIRVHQQAPGRVEEDVAEFQSGGPEEDRLPAQVLRGREPVHTWSTADGSQRALFLLPGERGDETLILMYQPDSEDPLPVRRLGRVRRGLEQIEHARIEVTPDGGATLSLDDGRGWEHVLKLVIHQATSPDKELVTPDGRVRVEVGDH